MTKKISLGKGKFALVDDEDYERVNQHQWYTHKSGRNWYAANNKTSMHRLIMDAPSGRLVDHINGNGLDNRRENLRLCSHAENQRNSGPRKKNKSGYKGVYKAHGKKWKSCISVNKKVRVIGYFDTPEEAARAYDDAARQLHGDFARFNFPD